jgi:hypothetical protein
VSYAILDNNRFYAEGLRYALLRRGVQLEVQSDTVQWQPTLLTRRVIVVRCRFSVAATHQALINILLRLEAARWKGSLSGLQRKGGRWRRIYASVSVR